VPRAFSRFPRRSERYYSYGLKENAINRDGASHGSQITGQRQLAGVLGLSQALGVDLATGRQDAERNSKALFCKAARTRSSVSCTSVSARPTSVKLGRPFAG
jgi:hypothetical protein